MFLFNRFKHNKNPGYRPELDRVTVTDIEYGSVEPELEYPKEFLPLDNPIPDYQNGQGECTLQGVSYAIRLWSKKLYNKDWNPSEAYLYAMSEKKEMEDFHRDYPTPGGWIKNGLSVAQHNGVCEEKYWNPEKRQSFETYVDWKKLPLEAHENAKEHKIGLWTRVDYSNPDQIMDAIWKYGGVIIGMKGWDKGWFQEISFPSQEGNSWNHCIVLDGYTYINNDLAFRARNWWDKIESNKGEGWAWCFLKWKDWKPFINGIFAITKYLSPKIMYQLRRDPIYTYEVYAIKGNVWRHIVNKQTLILGAQEPDALWIWQEGNEIPIAVEEEMKNRLIASEMLLLPIE